MAASLVAVPEMVMGQGNGRCNWIKLDNEYSAVTSGQPVNGVCKIDIEQYEVKAHLDGKCTLTPHVATEEAWGPSWSYLIHIDEAVIAIDYLFVRNLKGSVEPQRFARWNKLVRTKDALFRANDQITSLQLHQIRQIGRKSVKF